jgi:hypothetical protein
MIENIFTASPAEIDSEIARLQGVVAGLTVAAQHAQHAMDSTFTTEAGYAQARGDYAEAWGKINVLDALISAMEREFVRRGGWARYYVVDNNNGHLHTSTACQNTYETTSWVWMPGMSGLTHAQAVDEGGSLSCLTCFGEFREEIEMGRAPRFETPRMVKTREEREAAAAKKAEKNAKATANGITAPDGSPLKDDDGYTIKTLRSAQIAAVNALEQSGLDAIYADQTPAEDASHVAYLMGLSRRDREYAIRLIEAIAAKQDRALAEVLDEIVTKAAKKLAPARKDEAARKAAGKTAVEWYTNH